MSTTMDFDADIQSLQRGVAERDELLCELVEMLRDYEPGLKRVLQSMYNLVQDNLLCSTQLMHKVVSALISGSQEETTTRRRLLARSLVCVQLQVRRMPADDGALLLQELLARTSDDVHPYAGQILDHLFNDFVRVLGADCFLRLLDATRRLLLSEEPHDRKSSYFLISKIQNMCAIDGERNEALLSCLQCSAKQWTAFAVIIVDLEEQDSHLVVSTLEKQLPQLQLMSSDFGERWLSWLRTLCLRLLQEERIQVLRKTIEYFLIHLSVDQLCSLSLLSEFLMATNRSQLFDPEDDNSIQEEQLEQFKADVNVNLLLEALVEISWENVPLLLWICTFRSENVKSVPKELIIKLCLVVRAIDNDALRQGAQRRVFLLFEDTIDRFFLTDYMICIESLYQKWDPYREHHRLLDKIAKCTDFEEHIDCFNRRSYDIIFYRDWNGLPFKTKFLETLLLKMKSLPKHKHGFLRLVLFKPFMDFYRKFYNVDISMLQKGASLEKMQDHLLDRMKCKTDEETSFLKARCVALFISNLESWRQLEELNLDPLELMDKGTDHTITALTELLGKHMKRIRDAKVLPALIARVRRCSDIENVLHYAYQNLTEEEYESYITNFMLQKKYFLLPNVKLNVSFYLKLLLHGEPTSGFTRIEAGCAYNLLKIVDLNANIRYSAIWNLYRDENTEIKSKIFKELLRINEKLSIKHPNYTENSEMHRQKIRIASALITLCNYCDDPKSLETLLLPSDHLGINLMHEFLVGNCVKNIDWVLKALPSLQPRLQESYLSIAHIFISKNLVKLNEENKLSEMLSQLLPFTMGSTYSTRILAQLILHKLAVKCRENRICNPLAEVLINSLKTSLGIKLYELQSEPRLLFAEYRFDDHFTCMLLLYITNAPFDEIGLSINFENKYRKARHAFLARKLPLSEEIAPPKNLSEGLTLAPLDVINPKKTAGQDLILVASLLDKEIDFAGLRRTFEKFGFNFLVVAEESHLAETSSGTLSIAKIKSENLVEFILAMQAEGYRIVGSKVSAGIPKFDHFDFPKKCILVLGHGSQKIPNNVTELLDYVVEMPQFGSLDTNLESSLLIWEFFKQHCA